LRCGFLDCVPPPKREGGLTGLRDSLMA